MKNMSLDLHVQKSRQFMQEIAIRSTIALLVDSDIKDSWNMIEYMNLIYA